MPIKTTQAPQAKRWETVPVDEGAARTLATDLNLPIAVARILVSRGYGEPKAADRFLAPRLSDLGDPLALPNLRAAVDRIWTAIDGGERMAIFGDYDVDGISSTSLLTRVLSRLGGQTQSFLPDRESEGYGFTEAALARCLAESNPTLIITVDCGTNSVEAVEVARRRKVDVIVTDHHAVSEEPAAAVALVNPQLGDEAGLQTLAGVGVAFKLCHGLIKVARDAGRACAGDVDLKEYLDLVALGTMADIVPLVGENRTFARHGLARMNQKTNAGLSALIDVAGVKGPVEAYHVGFVLGPRLNAVGRLGSALASLELLTSDDPQRAGELSVELDRANRERRDVERKIVEEAIAEIDEGFDPEQHFGIVVARRGWHMGVVGIVASRLVSRYRRPAVVIAINEEGEGRGSCRSVKPFNMVDGLQQCTGHLLKHGGHAMAAGLSLHESELEGFRDAFNRACRAELADQDLRAVVHVDGWLTPPQADWDLCEALHCLMPYGEANPQPVFGIRDLRIVGEPRTVGTNHLKMTLAAGGSQWDSIAFGMADREIPDGPVDVVFFLEKNSFMGRDSLQMNIRDFRPAAPAPPALKS